MKPWSKIYILPISSWQVQFHPFFMIMCYVYALIAFFLIFDLENGMI
jgi:hypothetical protein